MALNLQGNQNVRKNYWCVLNWVANCKNIGLWGNCYPKLKELYSWHAFLKCCPISTMSFFTDSLIETVIVIV